MFSSLSQIFARRATVLPLVGVLAVAATACQGVGLTEARQAVDNQRAINEIEERELLPIQDELDALYEDEIIPRERELEDLWDQVQDFENGGFKNSFGDFQDPWSPGGEAYALQQEFDAKYAEIDRQYRELDVEARRIQIDMQWTDTAAGIDPAIAALEDERFALQRQLDRLHQFGRRPIEDLYQQMNELNASNGWSQSDIYSAEELNRQIADLQNQIAHAHATGAQSDGSNRDELSKIENELNLVRSEGSFPIQERYNRIAELEQQLAGAVNVTAAGGDFNADGTVKSDDSTEIRLLEEQMFSATEFLRQELERLNADLDTNSDTAQAEINALLEQVEITTVDPIDTVALQAEIDELQQQIIENESSAAPLIADYDTQIADLQAQIGEIYQLTDTETAGMQAAVDALQEQINALDTTADNYTDTKSGLEGEIATLQSSMASAIATESADVAALEALISAHTDGRATVQAHADSETAGFQAHIAELQALIDAANSDAGTSTAASQEILDQITAIEQNRDTAASTILAEIDSVIGQITEIEADYLAQIAELQQSDGTTNPAGATTTVPDATADLQIEIQLLRDQAFQLEQDLDEKVRVLEERRNELHSSLDSTAAGRNEIVADLELKLVHLHDELNELQNSGFDASRNHDILMEELQSKAVQLEKQLSLDIRGLEDEIWELDGQVNEAYRSGNKQVSDPHAAANEQLKEIELKRFELETLRWDLDDEQQNAFDQFNDVGFDQQAEMDALREEKLAPTQTRIDELEDELRELRIAQREIEDRLRNAEKLVEEQRRELENQTLDLIDEAVTGLEENGDGLAIIDAIATEAVPAE